MLAKHYADDDDHDHDHDHDHDDHDDDHDDEVLLNVLGCRHISDKLRPMPKHGSINLYAHGSQKARYDGQPRMATSTLTHSS